MNRYSKGMRHPRFVLSAFAIFLFPNTETTRNPERFLLNASPMVSANALSAPAVWVRQTYLHSVERREQAQLAALLAKPFPPKPDGTSTNGQALKPILNQLRAELDYAEEIEKEWEPAFTVIGSARHRAGNPMYERVVNRGRTFRLNGIPLRTGAGPGIMEAALRGFKEAPGDSKTQGIRIYLPWEKDANPYVDLALTCQRFATRMRLLFTHSRGVQAEPGGFGTLSELMQALRRGLPVVASHFWEPAWRSLEAAWREREYPEPTHSDLLFTDNEEEIIRFALNHPRPTNGYFHDHSRALRDVEVGLRALSDMPKALVFIGEPLPRDRELRAAKDLARYMLRRGIVIRSANRGLLLECLYQVAREEGRLHQLQAVVYVPEGVEITRTERDLFAQKQLIRTIDDNHHQILLTKGGWGFVALPGELETLDMATDILTLMQTGKISKRPLILIGPSFWSFLADNLVPTMLSERPPLISQADPSLFHRVSTSEEALRALGIGHPWSLRWMALRQRGADFLNGLRRPPSTTPTHLLSRGA